MEKSWLVFTSYFKVFSLSAAMTVISQEDVPARGALYHLELSWAHMWNLLPTSTFPSVPMEQVMVFADSVHVVNLLVSMETEQGKPAFTSLTALTLATLQASWSTVHTALAAKRPTVPEPVMPTSDFATSMTRFLILLQLASSAQFFLQWQISC